MDPSKGSSPCSACQPKRNWSEIDDILEKGDVGITIYRYKKPVHDIKMPFGKVPRETLVFYTTKSVAWRNEETAVGFFTTSELPKCAKYCARCKELLRRIELQYKDASTAEREAGLSELFSCPPCTDIMHKFRKFSQETTVTKVDSELIHLSRQTSPHNPRIDAIDKARRSEKKTMSTALQTNEVAGIRAIKEKIFGKSKHGNEDTMNEALAIDGAAAARSAKDKVQKKRGKGSDIELKQKSSELLKSKIAIKDKKIKDGRKIARKNKVGEDQDKENERDYNRDHKSDRSKDGKYVDGKGSKRGERKEKDSKDDDGRDSNQVENKGKKRGEAKDSKHVDDKDNKRGEGKDSKQVDSKSSKRGDRRDSKRGDTRQGDGRDSMSKHEGDRDRKQDDI